MLLDRDIKTVVSYLGVQYIRIHNKFTKIQCKMYMLKEFDLF